MKSVDLHPEELVDLELEGRLDTQCVGRDPHLEHAIAAAVEDPAPVARPKRLGAALGRDL